MNADKVINQAKKYIGVTRGSATHLQMVNKYNSVQPLPVGYVVKTTDDWCDVFVSFIGIELGISDLIGRECGVERHINIFEKLTIWDENGSKTPQKGDIITFNWNSFGQPNNGFADHIGFVESVSGGRVYTIEGNSGGQVARRNYAIGNGYIRGYARPKYNQSSNVVSETPSTNKPETTKPVVTQIAVDGMWGKATTRRLQEVYGLYADGVISHQYKQVFNQFIYSAEFDTTLIGSNLIRHIQKQLGLGQDGLCGQATIKGMQRHAGTMQDGFISEKSDLVRHIQRKLNSNEKPF